MRAEIIRELLRPYAGNIVDTEIVNHCKFYDDDLFELCKDKYNLLSHTIILTTYYPLMILYVENFLKEFTPDELNSRKGNRCSNKKNILYRIMHHDYDEKILKMLVDAGFNMNLQDSRGLTPLADLIFHNKSDERVLNLVEMYLNNGADVNFEFYFSFEKYTVLSLLLSNSLRKFFQGDLNLIKCLLNHGATCDLEQIEKYNLSDHNKKIIIDCIIDSLAGKYTKSAKNVCL